MTWGRRRRGSTSSTRPIQFQRDAIVDSSDMDRIFPVNLDTTTPCLRQWAASASMGTLGLAWTVMPKIVMELKGDTVGGGYSGFSGASSYHYGLFSNPVQDIDIVLGDGFETASCTHNVEILEHAAGSLGTF